MELVQHASELPWLVDAAYFMRLTQLAVFAVALLMLVGVVYAALHRMLSNAEIRQPESSSRPLGGRRWEFASTSSFDKETDDEI
jgi:hypothetical protein